MGAYSDFTSRRKLKVIQISHCDGSNGHFFKELGGLDDILVSYNKISVWQVTISLRCLTLLLKSYFDIFACNKPPGAKSRTYGKNILCARNL